MLAKGTRIAARPQYCERKLIKQIRRLLRISVFAIATVLPTVVAPTNGAAQSREILLGTMTSSGPNTPGDRERAANELFADGISALERGDVMLGRRRLEVLVERYPEAAAAGTARDELGALYSAQRRQGLLAVRDGDASESVQPEPIDERNRTARPNPVREAAREQTLAQRRQLEGERRLQVLAADFQSSAGDRVFFAESSAELGAKARAVLTAQARWLSSHLDLPVTIEAHADDHRGNRELDVRLAEKRGEAVRERLQEQGIAPERITVQAFGRDRPVATCTSPECAVQNRRVVTRIGAVEAADNVVGRGREAPALATAPRAGARTRSD